MAQLPVANLKTPLTLISIAAGFPTAFPFNPTRNIPPVFASFGLTMTGLSPTFYTYPTFNPNSIGTDWPSGLFMTPIKPLPINGSGGGGGPVGYGF